MNAPVFALCYLPPLGELGTPPPVSLVEVLSQADSERPLFEAIALEGDLAFYEDGNPACSPVVLENITALPEFLHAEDADARYQRLMNYQIEISQRYGAPLLARRAAFEWELRRALIPQRTALLNRELVNPERDIYLDDADLIAECQTAFATAENAHQALQAINRCRYDFLSRYEKFEFSLDQFVRYALMVLVLAEASDK